MAGPATILISNPRPKKARAKRSPKARNRPRKPARKEKPNMARKRRKTTARRRRRVYAANPARPRRRRARRNSIAVPNPRRRRRSYRRNPGLGSITGSVKRLASMRTIKKGAAGVGGFMGTGFLTQQVAKRWKPAKGGWIRVGVKAASAGLISGAVRMATRDEELANAALVGGLVSAGVDAVKLATGKAGNETKGFIDPPRMLGDDNSDDVGMLADYIDDSDYTDAAGFTNPPGRRVSSVGEDEIVANYAAA